MPAFSFMDVHLVRARRPRSQGRRAHPYGMRGLTWARHRRNSCVPSWFGGSIVTVARTDNETLPPLAQRLCSQKETSGLARRFSSAVSIGTLVPLLITWVGALVFLDELKDAQIGTEVWGLPVVAIGEEPRGWISIGRRPVGVVAISGERAVGVVAISGGCAVGVLAIAPLAIGVVAIGAMGIGVVSLGAIALGLWSLGAFSMGWISFGALGMGRLAFGGLTFGWYSCGDIVAVGAYAWGMAACGFYRAESWATRSLPWSRLSTHPPPWEWLLFPNWRRQRPAGDRPP